MTLDVVLALDVGGSKLAGALVDRDGRIQHDIERQTPKSDAGGDPGLAGTATLASDLREYAIEAGWRITRIGAGFPEYVDTQGHLTSREVLAWTSQPAHVLASVCDGVGCVIESDVRCGAIAEWRIGAGAGYPGLFYVSLGTGLSSATIADGQLVRGALGEAIALGELGIPASLDADWSGSLETYASGHGLAERWRQRTGEHLTARELTDRASTGDRPATALLESTGRALGTALGDIVALLDPPVVVLGGGLGAAATPLTEQIRAAYDQRTARRPNGPPIVTAGLGPRAGVIGAALFALGETA